MEVEIALPLDSDGFLRRECPSCERQFKWFHGQTADRPDHFLDPPLYTCPYCGEAAGHDSWWTKEQLEFAQGTAAGPAMDAMADELARAFRNTPGIRIERSHGHRPDPPMPLVEPDDMTMVASPCHGFEPVKVADDWTEPLYCLVCGQAFRL
jgi:hypothetical protein